MNELKQRLFIFLAIVLFIFSKGFSQSSSITFDQLTDKNGLSGSMIKTIVQDRKGFLWFGSGDGLNRYDGYVMKYYNHKLNDTNSLADNFIVTLFNDQDDHLWIGTINGLSIYNYFTDNFESYSGQNIDTSLNSGVIYSITQDKWKNIWVATSRTLYIIDADQLHNKKKTELRYKFKPITSFNDAYQKLENGINYNYIYMDHDSNIWIATNNGTYKILFNNSNSISDTPVILSFFHDASNPASILSDQNFNITEDNLHHILITCTAGLKMSLVNNKKNYFKQEEYIFRNIRLTDENNNINEMSNYISSITTDKMGTVYLGTNETGLFIFKASELESKKEKIHSGHQLNSALNPQSLLSNQVFSVYHDHSGLIWIGTYVGVSVLNPLKQNFNSRNTVKLFDNQKQIVSAITKDAQGAIWIGTDQDGISKLDLTSESLKQTIRVSDGLSNNTICSIIVDKQNNLWCGTADGLNFISHNDIQNKQSYFSKNIVTRFNSINRDSIMGTTIYTILEKHNDAILLGSNNGLFSIRNISDKRLEEIRYTSNPAYYCRIVRCLLEDHLKNLWIGSENGLFKISPDNKPLLELYEGKNGLSHNRISSLLEDSEKNIWIGTNGGGLNKYNPSTNKIEIYTIDQGLPNNVINGILEDSFKKLWISTNKGLVRFDKEKNEVVSYSEDDGLTNNNFMIGAAYKLPSGEMFFGNKNGFNSFFPDQITKNTFVPPVVITDFKIFDKSVFGTGYEKIKNTLLTGNFIELDYNQNFFSFEFAALNYINSANNQYKYMLQGVDEDWVNNRTRRFASYTNINPGTYKFMIKGSNNDGIWNETGVSVTIRIIPPYYKTWWFRIIGALLLATLIYFITQTRISAIRQAKEKEVIENSSRLKQQFLANMSHEIRTPMNAIVGMTRLLIDKEPRVDQKKYLSAIEQSSGNLLVIINDILDFSKIEAGKLELEYIPFNISSLLEGMYNTMQFKANEKGLHLSYEISADVPPAFSGDSVRLNEILLNLVGNAIKFTLNGSVKIMCRNLGNYIDPNGKLNPNCANIEFTVADTGIGIPEDRLESIFESFSQASSDTTRKFGGTGLGLTISKHLVELHGGKISVKSVPGEGTIFTFVIPFEITDSSFVEKEKAISKNESLLYLNKKKILLAEDNEFNQMVAVDTLQSYFPDITIEIANNGKEALEKLSATNFDLILMDIQMPEMDGYAASTFIRNEFLPPKNKVKIMAMTAGALKSEIQQCMDSGMDDYITKPFDPHLLIEKMSRLLPDNEKIKT